MSENPLTVTEPASQPSPVLSTSAATGGMLAMIMLGRLALNLQIRFIYPFLPAISRGLGVSLATATLLLTVRSLASAASPILGILSDRFGHRWLMLFGLILLPVGSLLVVIAPAFGWVLVAFVLLGIAKASYDPAMQAYISDTVPYTRRGRILSIIELSWSLSWLIGVPVAGFLIAGFGWRSPFAAVGVLGVACLFLATRVLRSDRFGPPARSGRADRSGEASSGLGDTQARRRPSLRQWLQALGGAAMVALVVNLLQTLAVENVFVVYGVWLEDRFGLNVTTLGLASMVIAVSELVAESSAAGLVDRIGKRKSVLYGLLLSALAYLLLPRFAGSLIGALAGVCLLFLAFEFGVVAALPLMSELAPGARATAMALNVGAMSVGRTIATLTAPRLWLAGGLTLNTGISAAVVLIAAVLLWVGVREQAT